MKCVLVCLAVMTTTFHTSQAMCRLQRDNGDIRVRGFETDTFKAGRMEICHQGQWWEVCDDGWDRNSAQTVCKQLGFTEVDTVWHCTQSCFGTNGNGCIFPCETEDSWSHNCNKAGIVCGRNPTMPPPAPAPRQETTPPTAQTPPTTACQPCMCASANTTPMVTERAGGMAGGMAGVMASTESCPSLAALGGGLGGLCAILAILLVGVVMGWVWTCHRKTGKPESSSEFLLDNPTYSSFLTAATPPEPSPAREAPTPSAPPSSQQPPIYAVVDKKKKATHLSQEVEQEERGEEEGGGGGEVGNHDKISPNPCYGVITSHHSRCTEPEEISPNSCYNVTSAAGPETAPPPMYA